MGQVDCWPMQCPPMLPAGAGGCTDSTAKTFADYNNPVAGCCTPRCDSKVVQLASSVAPTTSAVTNPCLQQQQQQQQQLDVYRGGENNDHNDNQSRNDNSNNNTMPMAVGKPCFYEGRAYHSGARWDDPVDMCTSCDCKVNRNYSCNFK